LVSHAEISEELSVFFVFFFFLDEDIDGKLLGDEDNSFHFTDVSMFETDVRTRRRAGPGRAGAGRAMLRRHSTALSAGA